MVECGTRCAIGGNHAQFQIVDGFSDRAAGFLDHGEDLLHADLLRRSGGSQFGGFGGCRQGQQRFASGEQPVITADAGLQAEQQRRHARRERFFVLQIALDGIADGRHAVGEGAELMTAFGGRDLGDKGARLRRLLAHRQQPLDALVTHRACR
jgi:hypothetical protein